MNENGKAKEIEYAGTFLLFKSSPHLSSFSTRLEKLLIIISCFLSIDYVCNCAYPTSIKKEDGHQLIEIYKDIAFYKYILHVPCIVYITETH